MCAAFREHVDAAAAFAHRADERRHLGIARQPRRHRQAAFAVVRRARAAGEADGAVRHRIANDRLHLRDLGGSRLAARRVVAHHVGSHRRMADVGGDVGDAAAGAQLRHVLAEALEAPVDAGAQRVDRHAFDLGEVPHRDLAIGGPARRDREAAVADHRRRHAERGRGRECRIPGDLRVEVGVAVDDAGHQREPVGGDRPRGVDVEPGPTATTRPRSTATSPRCGSPPRPSTTSASRKTRSITPSSGAARRRATPSRAASCTPPSRCPSPRRTTTGSAPSSPLARP